jgi:hypothetical protein
MEGFFSHRKHNPVNHQLNDFIFFCMSFACLFCLSFIVFLTMHSFLSLHLPRFSFLSFSLFPIVLPSLNLQYCDM